jgi:cytoskeletal protein RodZ
MSINLHIQAVDGEDLRRQLTSILGLRAAEDNYGVETPVDSAAPLAEGAPEPDKEAPKATRRRTSKVEQTVRGTTEAEASAETTNSAFADAAEAGEQAGDGAKTADASTDSDQSATSSSTSAASTGSDDGSDVTIDTIRELTLSVVDKRGKEGIEAVLSQFGVARSTQVPEEQWGELAQALRDALED